QESKKFNVREILFHPMMHTLKIFFFIFIVTFLLNAILFKIGSDVVATFLSGHVLLQPFFAALIGLIPNCASSVALAELYLKGAITYGAVIAGLCASGGLGILVLFREEKNKREAFKVIALLFVISVIAGMLIQYYSLL
ncbi:MAG: putative manganese transporter, partial [Nanoarchaeota archaeon]|nr:putative manganese transporter [Nanoarchaeota archaeon]